MNEGKYQEKKANPRKEGKPSRQRRTKKGEEATRKEDKTKKLKEARRFYHRLWIISLSKWRNLMYIINKSITAMLIILTIGIVIVIIIIVHSFLIIIPIIVKINTVEPRSNGSATNGIPPIIDTNSPSLKVNFFFFLCWQQ